MTGVNLTLAGRRFASVLPPPLSRIQEAITAQPLLADASLLALYDVQAYATGDLSQANAFDEVFDFSRASTAEATNVSGSLTQYAVDVPLFDYDPLTTAPNGLLIKPADAPRAADLLEVKPAVVADVVSAAEGTVFVEVTPYLLDYTQNIFTLGAPGGTGSGYRIQLNMSNAGSSQLASVTASGVSAVSTLISPLIGQPNKIAFTYKAGRLSLCLNGATVFENASADIPTSFDEFIIGNTTIANAAAAAHFAKVAYIPRALTDAELQAITS